MQSMFGNHLHMYSYCPGSFANWAISGSFWYRILQGRMCVYCV